MRDVVAVLLMNIDRAEVISINPNSNLLEKEEIETLTEMIVNLILKEAGGEQHY